MPRYLLDGTEVKFIREAHQGDRGYNPSKGHQVLVENPIGSGSWTTIPYERLVMEKEEGEGGRPEDLPPEPEIDEPEVDPEADPASKGKR